MKIVTLVMSVAGWLVATGAEAALTGSLGFAPWNDTTGGYGSGGLRLAHSGFVNATPTGVFASSVVPLGGTFTMNTTQITGLGATPKAVTISDFFVFSSPFIGAGTTPQNRFHFDLATLTQTGTKAYSGTGTIHDLAGVYLDAPAQFSISFSSSYNYAGSLSAQFTPAPVPEPTTWIAGALLLLPLTAGTIRALRRRG
jgi:hypothetical protein